MRVRTQSESTTAVRQTAGTAITINGTVPGPLVRLREGSDAILRVTNGLKEDTSIHWHGLLMPPGMDGVPGVSFAGIKPGETFTYRFEPSFCLSLRRVLGSGTLCTWVKSSSKSS